MCAWAEFRAALKCGGVPWVSGVCWTLVYELLTPRGRNSSALSVTLPTQNLSVFFSPLCNEVPALPDTFLVGHCRGCAPREAGLGVSVACNVVAREGNKDLGTANPGGTCHIPCLVVPFSISHGLPVFRSSLVWPISGCYSSIESQRSWKQGWRWPGHVLWWAQHTHPSSHSSREMCFCHILAHGFPGSLCMSFGPLPQGLE